MTRASRLNTVLLSLIFCLASPVASFATGFGAYLEFLHAEGDIDPGTSIVDDLDYDAEKFGFGFALDTNLAQNRLFNYRLSIGYQHTDREFDNLTVGNFPVTFGNIEADGLSINNAFGFGMWRGRNHRLWAGPTFRLGVDVFDTNDNDVDIVDVSVGGGAVVGLNLHAGRFVTIGLTAGYQYLYVGEIVYVDTPNFDETETFDGNEHLVSVNVSIFFRTRGDRFRSR
jgi:hypothetical protein